MAIVSDTTGLDIRRANRRGFLMGVTLAEFMLTTLFVLLLMLEDFGQIEEDLGGREAVRAVRELAEHVKGWAEQQERPLPEIWRILTPRSDGPRSDPDAEIRELEAEVERLTTQLAGKDQVLTKARQRLDQAHSQQSKLDSELRDEQSWNEELEREIAGGREGGLVLCAYERPATADALHGKSVALGTVHLQHDGIILIHKRPGLRNLEVVDKVGAPYDLNDALDRLDTWPVGTKRSFEDFRNWGEEFVRIGDREAERRQKCRFSMGYYIDECVHSDVLTDVFERYFFKQPLNSITREEYERLIDSGTNVENR